MSFVNLVVLTIVGEYSTLFVLRTAISDEAKRCGGTISGEIGTLPEATQFQVANTVELPVDEGRSRGLNGMEIGNDDENRHVTPLIPKVNKTTTAASGTSPKANLRVYNFISAFIRGNKGSVGTGGERKDGSGVQIPEDQADPMAFLSGKPLVAANIRVEDDGVLVITMKGQTGRFKLIEGDDTIHDDPLTFHFHVSALTNQEKVLKREKPPETVFVVYQLFSCILVILPYVFIFLLTGFRNGDSTSAQRGWMMSWLVFNQIFSAYGYMFSTTDIASLVQAAFLAVFVLANSAPAIGGFVMVGRMLFEFGTCSLS